MSQAEDQALFDSREAEKKSLGIVSEPSEEEKTETQEKEPETKKEEETPVVKDEEEEETESDEDEEESDDDSEDDEESEPTHTSSRDVIKKIKSGFKAKIAELEGKLNEAITATKKNEVIEDIDKYIEEQATALEVKPEVLKKLMQVQDSIFEKKYGGKLKELDEFQKAREAVDGEKFMQEQAKIFNDEWVKTEPIIKQRFPNASAEHLEAVKAEMDKLAHTEVYSKLPLAKIFGAELDTFSKVLDIPSKKTFETGRRNTATDQSEEFEGLGDITGKSPAELAQLEARRNAHMESYDRDKLELTTRDEMGNIVKKLV